MENKCPSQVKKRTNLLSNTYVHPVKKQEQEIIQEQRKKNLSKNIFLEVYQQGIWFENGNKMIIKKQRPY